MHFQGTTDATGLRIAIVVSRFNEFFTRKLISAQACVISALLGGALS